MAHKKIKIIIITIIITLFTTGCNVNYSIILKENLSVEENLNINANIFDDVSSEEIINTANLHYQDYFDDTLPFLNSVNEKDIIKSTYSNTYKTLENYKESFFCKNFNCNIIIYEEKINNKSYKNMQILLKYNSFMFYDCEIGIDVCPLNVYVNVSFPFEVISSNAISKDENNSLKWNLLDYADTAVLEIKYDETKMFDKNDKNIEKKQKNSILYLVLGFLIFILLLIILFRIKKKKYK